MKNEGDENCRKISDVFEAEVKIQIHRIAKKAKKTKYTI